MAIKHAQEVVDEVIKQYKNKIPLQTIYMNFPKIPPSTLYGWCVEKKRKSIPVEKEAPQPKQQPTYEKVELKPQPTKKKNIVLVCSEDPQAILDVLKGML